MVGGVLSSLLVEWLKSVFNVSGKWVVLIVAVVSLVAALIYKTLLFFGYWEAFLGILMTAGAFYAFIIKNIPSEE